MKWSRKQTRELKKIISSFIKSHQDLSQAEIAEHFSVSQSTISRIAKTITEPVQKPVNASN
jgi:predicted XRE-type DNA-binding protein